MEQIQKEKEEVYAEVRRLNAFVNKLTQPRQKQEDDSESQTQSTNPENALKIPDAIPPSTGEILVNSNCAVTTQRSESTSAQNQSSKEPKEAKVDHMQILQSMMRQHDQQMDIMNQSKIKIQEELSALKLKH